MKALSNKDFSSRLQKAGISGAVAASQIVEATKLYISNELQYTEEQLQPVSVRHSVLVVKSSHPAYSQKLQERQDELMQYIHSSYGVTINRIQFII